ncbi:MAG: hypothetical protein OHK0039_26720 [Bacteroidia bacterium]
MNDDFKRLQRMARSLVPRFPRNRDRYYSHADARNIINDLGMSIPPAVLADLVGDDEVLDDFINSLYELEQTLGKQVVTPYATLDEAWTPRVYVADGLVAFTITRKGKEMIFAEYKRATD